MYLKKVPGLVRLVRSERKLYRDCRTLYLQTLYPNGSYLRCGGIDVFCDFNDATYAWYDGLSTNLAMDQKVIETVLGQIVRRGNVFIDIGAHYGFFTAYLAYMAQKCRIANAKVIALEPDHQHFRCLQKTAERYSQTEISLLQMALADKDGTLNLYRTQNDCLHTYPTEDSQVAYSVPAISLDSLVEKYLKADDRVAFVKIDVDGAEPVLFSGGKKTLKSHNPIIFMEFAPIQLQGSGIDAKSFYERLCDNFDVYWISYQLNIIRKVDRSEYDDIESTVGNAITDLVLSPIRLNLSEIQPGPASFGGYLSKLLKLNRPNA